MHPDMFPSGAASRMPAVGGMNSKERRKAARAAAIVSADAPEFRPKRSVGTASVGGAEKAFSPTATAGMGSVGRVMAREWDSGSFVSESDGSILTDRPAVSSGMVGAIGSPAPPPPAPVMTKPPPLGTGIGMVVPPSGASDPGLARKEAERRRREKLKEKRPTEKKLGRGGEPTFYLKGAQANLTPRLALTTATGQQIKPEHWRFKLSQKLESYPDLAPGASQWRDTLVTLKKLPNTSKARVNTVLNVVEGVELFEQVLSPEEQNELLTDINVLRQLGLEGQLPGGTFTELSPEEAMSLGYPGTTMRFGCAYDERASNETADGIKPEVVVAALPDFLQRLIDR